MNNQCFENINFQLLVLQNEFLRGKESLDNQYKALVDNLLMSNYNVYDNFSPYRNFSFYNQNTFDSSMLFGSTGSSLYTPQNYTSRICQQQERSLNFIKEKEESLLNKKRINETKSSQDKLTNELHESTNLSSSKSNGEKNNNLKLIDKKADKKVSTFNKRPDCLRKRIKTLANRYINKKLNILLRANTQKKLRNLPLQYNNNVNKQFNKNLVDRTILSIYTELIPDIKDQGDAIKIKYNQLLIEESSCNELKNTLQRKWKELYTEYLESSDYQKDTKYLLEIEGNEYVTTFKNHAENLVSYYQENK